MAIIRDVYIFPRTLGCIFALYIIYFILEFNKQEICFLWISYHWLVVRGHSSEKEQLTNIDDIEPDNKFGIHYINLP